MYMPLKFSVSPEDQTVFATAKQPWSRHFLRSIYTRAIHGFGGSLSLLEDLSNIYIYNIISICIHIHVLYILDIYIYDCWLNYPSEKYEFVKRWENRKCSKPPTRYVLRNLKYLYSTRIILEHSVI